MKEAQLYLSKAKAFFREASLLYEKGFWNGTTNRAYYAMFSAARALLIYKGIRAKTHSGVHQKFNELLFNEKILPLELAKMLNRAFQYRQEADYEPEVEIDEETASNIYNDALVFVEQIEAFLKDI